MAKKETLRMRKSKRPDAEDLLIQQLGQDPEDAMAELAYRYTGLVKSTAERYLRDPEDVKECINDTFMEFFHTSDRFDSSKGSLSTYLSAIARNLAISRYRKNAAQSTVNLWPDLADEHDPIGDAERRMDLEQAIERLSPEDAGLIRQKYYGGMTLQEIADAEDLPYETVKKRHQRSLTKLKALLITGLVLLAVLALAACTYMVLRHFGLLPGYGISTDSDSPVYLLAEDASAEGEDWIYTVDEAVLMEGTLRINVTVRFSQSSGGWERWMAMRSQYEHAYIENPSISGTFTPVEWIREAKEDGSGQQASRIELGVLPEDTVFPLDQEEVPLTVHLFEAELPIIMRRAELENPEDCHYTLGEEGGILAVPKREDGMLSVELYPLNTGMYEISPDIIYGAYRQGKNGDITVTGENGQILAGNMSMIPSLFPGRLSTWDFGPAEPGAYVLHIPYVYLLYKISPEHMQTIPVNLETCQWEEQVMELPFGTIYPVSCEKAELEEYPGVPAWRIVLRLDTEVELSTPPLSIRIMGTDSIAVYTALPDQCYEITIRLPTEEEQAGATQPDLEPIDLTQAQITLLGTISLRWDQELTIPFTVE